MESDVVQRASDQPYLIVLRAGPVWDLRNGLGHLAEAFAREFEGEISTRSGARQDIPVGNFRIRALPWGSDRVPSILRRLWYVLRVTIRGLWLRWVRGRRLIVIAYDPFESGAIGLALRWFAGATFVCEVNGVYGDEANLIDEPDQEAAAVKRNRMLRIGSFILRRAHAIKLLFPDQLVGFQVDPYDPPRACFFDLIDTRIFEPEGIEPQDQLVFVGHPFRRKGVDLLLRAFARLADEFPAWRLVLVGWGIEAPANDLEFPRERVEFLGPQSPRELANLIERSSALVLPSRSEAMGRVLLEAARLGRPRIGSRVGGIPSFIQHDRDGLLFEPNDADALEAALRGFMKMSSSERRNLGAAARDHALVAFTSEAYLSSYQALLARTGRT